MTVRILMDYLRDPEPRYSITGAVLRRAFKAADIELRSPQRYDRRGAIVSKLVDPEDPGHRLEAFRWSNGRKTVHYSDSRRAIVIVATVPDDHEFHTTLSLLKERVNNMAMQRPDFIPEGATYSGATEVTYWKGLTTLIEYMTDTTWEGGDRRTPCTLTLFFQTGMCKAMIKCKDTGRVAFHAAPTWGMLFDELDSMLASGHLEWRTDKPPATRGTPGGKR